MATFKRVQSLVLAHNKQVFLEQNPNPARTEAQQQRDEQNAINQQCVIADKIEDLELTKKAIKEFSKQCEYVKTYFS